MTEIVIIDAVRTPLGRRNGWLRETHPVRLGSAVLCELLRRTSLDPSQLDHVIMGCVGQVGEQTFNLARNVVLDADIGIETPATTIDFQCGSSQQAIHLAAGMVATGQARLVLAGGVESMSRVPMGSSLTGGSPFTDGIMARHNIISQGEAADKIAARWNIPRDEVDTIGYHSHMRAAAATQDGVFERELLPLPGVDDQGQPITVTTDQGIRASASLEKMASLQPAFTEHGVTTAGNSSQITDGAAAVLVTTADHAAELGLTPRARILSMVTIGSDPHLMLTGPIAATQAALVRGGLRLDDIDLFEINEAFAAVIAMWSREIKADMARVNVHGGAIALGHPLGASGARLMTTLINALETHDKRRGLQAMCCGGGLGTGTIIERL